MSAQAQAQARVLGTSRIRIRPASRGLVPPMRHVRFPCYPTCSR